MTSGVPNVVELTNPGWGWVNKTTLSYTFLAQAQLPAYYTPVVGNPAPGDKYFDVTPLSQAQQDAVVDLLKYVQSVIPIEFDPSKAGQLGDMTFGFADHGGDPRAGGNGVRVLIPFPHSTTL